MNDNPLFPNHSLRSSSLSSYETSPHNVAPTKRLSTLSSFLSLLRPTINRHVPYFSTVFEFSVEAGFSVILVVISVVISSIVI